MLVQSLLPPRITRRRHHRVLVPTSPGQSQPDQPLGLEAAMVGPRNASSTARSSPCRGAAQGHRRSGSDGCRCRSSVCRRRIGVGFSDEPGTLAAVRVVRWSVRQCGMGAGGRHGLAQLMLKPFQTRHRAAAPPETPLQTGDPRELHAKLQ